MSGFDNETVYANNWDFRGVQPVLPQVTAAGQLPIGTGSSPAILVGTITSPNGTVTVGYASPNITLDVEDAGFVWIDQAGAFTAAKNRGYFITGTATANLPAAPSQGDTLKFLVDHASQVLTIQAAAAQRIRIGSLQSSVAGTAVSTLQGDSLTLTYRASDTTWMCIDGAQGTWVLA